MAIYERCKRKQCFRVGVPLTPSKVDVPRPSSSRMTRLRDVLFSNIKLVSTISTMNVDRPLASSSEAIRL